jgi:predicted transposase YbfD/YdcC
MDIGKLKEKLERLTDPRRQWGNLRHNLEAIPVIGPATLVCDGEDFEDTEAFGREREEELRKFLELPNGIPDESTFFRVFKRIKPEELAGSLYGRLADAREGAIGAVNIDGKTIRGSGNTDRSAARVVSARAGEEEIIPGQVAAGKKSNEIAAIPKLPDLSGIKGAAVTIDAMGCQKKIAAKIRAGGGDYLLAVKDNRLTLHQDIREYFEGLETGEILDIPEDVRASEEETGHGRKERREVRTVTDIDRVAGKEDWEDLTTIIRYRCWRTVNGKQTVTDRYYISNTDTGAREYCRYLRGHWSIENRLHWCLDVVFREDAAGVACGHAPENMNVLRKMALTLLRAAPDPRTSGKKRKMTGAKRRFTAAMNPDYSLLFSLESKCRSPS